MAQMQSSSIRSYPAAVTKSLAVRMEEARDSGSVWKWLAIGAGFVPVVGFGLTYVAERIRNGKIENKELQVLSEYYRFQIAATLGMNPEAVGVSDLQLAAKVNPALGQAIQKVEEEKSDSNRFAGWSSAGMMVAGMIFSPAAVLAKVGVDMAGGVIGGVASGLLNKDVLHVNDVVEHIDAKLSAGQQIDATDIMMLRAAQDENWQAAFKERYKTPFHKMNPQMQQQVMKGMPDLLAGAEKQAYALNKGLVSPQSLVMEGVPAASGRADLVARRGAAGSYANAITSQRRAAARQQVVLS